MASQAAEINRFEEGLLFAFGLESAPSISSLLVILLYFHDNSEKEIPAGFGFDMAGADFRGGNVSGSERKR